MQKYRAMFSTLNGKPSMPPSEVKALQIGGYLIVADPIMLKGTEWVLLGQIAFVTPGDYETLKTETDFKRFMELFEKWRGNEAHV